jgi:hypothetical protein
MRHMHETESPKGSNRRRALVIGLLLASVALVQCLHAAFGTPRGSRRAGIS